MSSPRSGGTVDSELEARVLARLGVTSDAEFNLAQLYDATDPPSLIDLDRVVWMLVDRGQVGARYRVRSPFGDHLTVLRTDRFTEVPLGEELEDPWSEPPQSFRVEPDDIDVVFWRKA